MNSLRLLSSGKNLLGVNSPIPHENKTIFFTKAKEPGKVAGYGVQLMGVSGEDKG